MGADGVHVEKLSAEFFAKQPPKSEGDIEEKAGTGGCKIRILTGKSESIICISNDINVQVCVLVRRDCFVVACVVAVFLPNVSGLHVATYSLYSTNDIA